MLFHWRSDKTDEHDFRSDIQTKQLLGEVSPLCCWMKGTRRSFSLSRRDRNENKFKTNVWNKWGCFFFCCNRHCLYCQEDFYLQLQQGVLWKSSRGSKTSATHFALSTWSVNFTPLISLPESGRKNLSLPIKAGGVITAARWRSFVGAFKLETFCG